MRLRIYSEQSTIEELAELRVGAQALLSAVRGRLERRRETLGLQTPMQLELVQRVPLRAPRATRAALARALENPERLGVERLRLWPQLDREHGLYLNLQSASRFFEQLGEMLSELEHMGAPSPSLLFDLEPPIQALCWKGWGACRGPASMSAEQLAHSLATLSVAPSEQVAAMFMSPHAALQARFESFCQTPSAVGGRALVPSLDAMAYGSLLAWVLPRAWAVQGAGERWLRRLTLAHVERCRSIGAAPTMILGCIATGAMGNEACYEHPHELARAARAVGSPFVERLGLFELRGLFRSPRGEARDWGVWSDALLGWDERIDLRRWAAQSVGAKARAYAMESR